MSRIPKVRKSYDSIRKSPFKVSWTIDKKRHARYFQSEEEQEHFANQIASTISTDKAMILKLDQSTINDIIAIDKMRGNTPFMAIWEFYVRNNKVREVMTLLQGADAYIRSLWQQRHVGYRKHRPEPIRKNERRLQAALLFMDYRHDPC